MRGEYLFKLRPKLNHSIIRPYNALSIRRLQDGQKGGLNYELNNLFEDNILTQ